MGVLEGRRMKWYRSGMRRVRMELWLQNMTFTMPFLQNSLEIPLKLTAISF